jgi:hypothetical protein
MSLVETKHDDCNHKLELVGPKMKNTNTTFPKQLSFSSWLESKLENPVVKATAPKVRKHLRLARLKCISYYMLKAPVHQHCRTCPCAMRLKRQSIIVSHLSLSRRFGQQTMG